MTLQIYKIASTTLSAAASSIDFSNIPQGYTDLKVVLSVRNTTATTVGNIALQLKVNNGTTNYTGKQLYGTTSAGSLSPNNTNIGTIVSANDTTSTFSSVEVYIPNYAGSTAKSYSIDSVSENNSSTAYELDLLAKLQSATTAITSLNFVCSSDNFAANSTATLYGIL